MTSMTSEQLEALAKWLEDDCYDPNVDRLSEAATAIRKLAAIQKQPKEGEACDCVQCRASRALAEIRP